MKQELRVLAIGLAIFATYLPVAAFVHRDYVHVQRPSGRSVELMFFFGIDKPDRYVWKSYVFGPSKYPDTSQIRIYENMTPLPRENFQFTTDELAYVARFKTSDGSDPRTNGKKYWIVAPVDRQADP